MKNPASARGALLLVLLPVLGACRAPVQKYSGLAMSSPLNVLAAGRSAPDWAELAAYADREAALFDWRNTEGPVGRLNAGQGLAPSPEVAAALDRVFSPALDANARAAKN